MTYASVVRSEKTGAWTVTKKQKETLESRKKPSQPRNLMRVSPTKAREYGGAESYGARRGRTQLKK